VNVWNAKHTEKVNAIGAESGYVNYPLDYPRLPWQKSMCNCQSLEEVENNADAMGADPYTWASIAAVVAAAMPLILKLAGLLKKADVDTEQLNEDGMDAADEVIDEYNDSQEYPIDEDSGIYETDSPQYGIKASNNADGTATIQYTKSNINENGDIDYSGNNTNLNMMFENAKQWVMDNKTPLLAAGGILIGLKFLPDIIRSVSTKKRRR
jgi:hypothetical protein